jgi:hypothetical protein
MSDSDPGRRTETDEVSLVDSLAVIIRKRRLIAGVTALGLALAAIFVLLGHFAPVVTKGDAAHSARLYVLTLEPDLGNAAVAYSRSQSFEKAIEAAVGRPLSERQLAARVSISLADDGRTLIIVGTGRDKETAEKVARAALDSIDRLSSVSGGTVADAVAHSLRDEALNLTRQVQGGNSYKDLSARLMAAADARSQRLLMETYVRAIDIDPHTNPGDPISFVFASIVRTCQELEAKATDDLAADEKPAGILSKATADRLNVLVSANLGNESRLFDEIPRRTIGGFALVDTKFDPETAQSSSARTLVLAFFVSLFVGLILAFLSNAWDRIKADPDSVALLESAWKAPKRK